MANKITRKEIVENKVLTLGSDYAKSLQPAIDANEKWLQSFAPIKAGAIEFANIEKQFKISSGRKEFLEIKQKEEALRGKTAEAIKAEQNLLIQKQKIDQSILDTQKKGLNLTAQRNRIQKKSIQLTAQEKLELSILNKGIREAAVISSKLSTAYEKQSVVLTQLRRKYKDVALTQGESSKAAINLRSQIVKLDARLKRVDANVGQFQRSVGNYGKALDSAKSAARGLASALGLVGGAFLVVQVARDATKVIKDFEKQNATLSAVLQVAKEDMKELTDEAVRLGSTTVKTAGQVTELQIAYARLGFSQSEIIDLTEATINGSIALNAELANTANLTGAIVNTFDDLTTTDAPRIIDILSLSTAKSALNFEKLEKALPIVGGAANAAGVPFTKLIALLGKLADSGIDASSSSTALRNIFIESAAQGLNYGEILEKIKDSQDKLTASNDEFGKRAAVSATVLSANIDATNELDEALNRAAGTAERMANKELDTLDGALKLLRSAWEGYILGVNEAGGVSEQLKDFVKTLAENLDNILNTLVAIVKGFLVYKGVLLSLNLITKAYTASTVALRIAKIALAGGIGKATLAMRAFNLATKSNPIGLVLGLLAGGVATWLAFSDGTKEATDEMSKFNDEVERLEKSSDRFTKALDNVTEGRERANAAVLEQFNIEDKLEASLKRQGVNQSRINEALKLVRTSREKDIKAIDDQIERHATFTESQKRQIRSAISIAQTLRDIIDKNEKIDNERIKEKTKTLKEESEKERKLRLAIAKKLREDALKIESFQLNQQIEQQKEISENRDKSFEDRNAAILEQGALELELAKRIAEEKFSLEKGFGREDIEALLEGGELSKETLSKIGNEELLIIQEFQDKKDAIRKGTEEGEDSLLIDKIKSDAAIEKSIREKALNEELARENELFLRELDVADDREKAIEEHEKRIAEIKRRYALEALDVQVKAIETLLESEELSAEERAGFEAKLAKLKKDISDVSVEAAIENDEKEVLSTKEKTIQILEISKELTSALGDLANAILEGRIQKIDEEIEKEEEKFEKLLENENLNEEERKAIEAGREKKREELEAKKRKEQRKQAVLNKALAIADIGLNIALGITSALSKVVTIPLVPFIAALGAIQLAAAIASPIPKFAKGTKDAPEGLAVVDELRPEVHTDKDGNVKSYGSNKGANLRYLDRGDKIYKSHSDYKTSDDYKRILRAATLSSVEIDNKKLNTFQANQVFNMKNEELIKEQQLTRKAIQKLKLTTHVHQQKPVDFNHELFRLKNIS